VLCAPISYEFSYKIEGMSREMSIRIIVRVVERWSGARDMVRSLQIWFILSFINVSELWLDYILYLDVIYMIMIATKHTVFSVTIRNLPCIEAPAPPPMTIPLRIETCKCLETNVRKCDMC
jgi:hypothetical protein